MEALTLRHVTRLQAGLLRPAARQSEGRCIMTWIYQLAMPPILNAILTYADAWEEGTELPVQGNGETISGYWTHEPHLIL